LSVPTTTNFATCAHCGSSLAIRRTDTAHYTEVIERLEEQTERIDRELRDIRFEHQLIKLDQEWEEERTRYVSRSKNGEIHEPSIQSAVMILLLMGGSPLLVWVIMPRPRFGEDIPLTAVSLFILLMALMLTMGVIGAVSEYRRYKQYRHALKRYYDRRAVLLNSRRGNP